MRGLLARVIRIVGVALLASYTISCAPLASVTGIGPASSDWSRRSAEAQPILQQAGSMKQGTTEFRGTLVEWESEVLF